MEKLFDGLDTSDLSQALIALEQRLKAVFDQGGYTELNMQIYTRTLWGVICEWELEHYFPRSFNNADRDHSDFYDILVDEFMSFRARTLARQFMEKRTVGAIELLPPIRDKIHSLISIIRPLVEGIDCSERQKQNILEKLNEFQSEVDKRFTRFEKGLEVYYEVCRAAAHGAETLQKFDPIFSKLMRFFGKNEQLQEQELQRIGEIRREIEFRASEIEEDS